MKILNPGKVKKLKLTCPNCRCEFLYEYYGNVYFTESARVICPQEGCKGEVFLRNGEPYEEPTPTISDVERLKNLIMRIVNDTKNWSWADLARGLIQNGVTFREE